jgi:pimeloyl-ACP methyl ester carboxylesterase
MAPYTPPSSAIPFTLSIPDQDLSEFHQLLKLSKLPPLTWENQQTDKGFGLTHQWLKETKQHWETKYDWRAREKYINSFSNYKISINDEVGGEMSIHFIGLFSERDDATPIVMMHGWPGSFLEFLPVLELLKTKYGKDSPYHVIIPSLPGYTLSSGPAIDHDWAVENSARVIDKVMKELGFPKYIAQGGDVGSFVAHTLATDFESCIAVHLNMMLTQPPSSTDNFTAFEKTNLSRVQQFRATGMAYALEHGSRPSTISAVLSSSPLALLSWIAEKFHEWSDTTPPLETILDDITLWWFTNTMPRSVYPYRGIFSPTMPARIEKPFGFSLFPYEICPGMKECAEAHGNLVFYRQHEHGGHFAALEQPREFLEDVEEFVRVVGGTK